MDQGNFEDIVKRKLNGQEIPAPSSVWSGIGQTLDADLVVMHQARSARYLRLAVAAVFLMLISFGYILADQFTIESTDSSEQAFNALTGETPFLSSENPTFSNSFSGPQMTFVYLADRQGSTAQRFSNRLEGNSDTDDLGSKNTFVPFNAVEKKRPDLRMASISNNDIYRYRSGPTYAGVSKQDPSDARKVWAGIEAGAGSFSGALNNSNGLSSSLNSSSLAAASGISEFVNPSNTVNSSAGTGSTRSIGVDFGVGLGQKWTLESGLSLTDMQNSGVAAINVLDVYTVESRGINSGPSGLSGDKGNRSTSNVVEVRESFDTEVQIDTRVQFASVPVKAGYFLIQRKFSLRLNAGVAANYLLDGNANDPTSQIFSGANNMMYNDWSFDGLSGLEFGISLLDRFDFTLEPNYRYAIRPVVETNAPTSQFMVQTGLRYRIQ